MYLGIFVTKEISSSLPKLKRKKKREKIDPVCPGFDLEARIYACVILPVPGSIRSSYTK